LLAYPAVLEAVTQAPTAQAAATLASAADALDVYDFEAMALKVLPPAHWGYMATGVDGGERSGRIREASTGISCACAGSST
jgi:hypothetical protein